MKKLLLTFSFILISFLIYGCNSNKETTKIKEVDTQIVKVNNNTATPSTIIESPLKAEETSKPIADNILYSAFQEIDSNERKYGYIDINGTFQVPPEYITASDFHDGRGVVFKDGSQRIYDSLGNIIYESNYYIGEFENGAAIFSDMVNNELLFGYIDINGNIIVKPKYQMGGNFTKDNQALVYKGDGQYALIDKKGVELETYTLNDTYQYPVSIHDNLIIYSNIETGGYGLVDVKQNDIMEAIYNDIFFLGNERLGVIEMGGEENYVSTPCALFSTKGEKITNFTNYDISKYHNGVASVTDDIYTYFIDEYGKEVTSLPKLEGRGTLTLLDNDVIKAELDNELIYLTKDGEEFWHNNTKKKLSSDITVSSIKYKPSKYILVYYPVIKGLKDVNVQERINTKLYTWFTESRKDLTKEDNLLVNDGFQANIIHELITINRQGYSNFYTQYSSLPIFEFCHINSQTGDFYELSDLFKDKDNYLIELNQRIKTFIKSNPSYVTSTQDIALLDSAPPFTVTDQSLVLYFNFLGESVENNYPQFEIPFDEIMDIIDTKGDFWLSFNK